MTLPKFILISFLEYLSIITKESVIILDRSKNFVTRLLVTPTVCSNCADNDLSFVTAVHPSFKL